MKPPVLIPLMIVLALAIAGGAFWEGTNVGKAQAQSTQDAFFAGRGVDPNAAGGTGGTGFGGQGGTGTGRGGQGGAAGAGFAGRGARGTIVKVEGNTLTMTDNQGATVTVALSSSAPIVKTVTGTESDLKAGGHILVLGTRSGNNVAATSIQITDSPDGVPNLFGGGGNGAGGQRMTPTPTK